MLASSLNCKVCSQPAHGNHFGVISCRACAAFFRRFVLKTHRKLKCRSGNGNCEANNDGMFICKKCRMDKCFQVGMTQKNVQRDRDLISSAYNFAVARKHKLLSSIIPQSVQGYLGRPLFILACEPDLATSEKVFIDVKFLIDHALDLFDKPNSAQLNSMSILDRLSYGLKTSRLAKNDEIQLCNSIGKAEILQFWEHEFLTVAKWLTYCDEFQQLPRSMKLQFLKSTWYMWIRLERIATVAETVKSSCKTFMMTDDICIDLAGLDFDVSWFTRYKREQLSYFLNPMKCMCIPKIAEPLNQLEPSMQEMTYMLCLLSFRHGGKQLGGDIQKLTDRLMENVATDLHNYYVHDLKVVNYAGRITKMMKIVQLVEKDMHEWLERTELARMFDIFSIEFSHPEMFFGYKT